MSSQPFRAASSALALCLALAPLPLAAQGAAEIAVPLDGVPLLTEQDLTAQYFEALLERDRARSAAAAPRRSEAEAAAASLVISPLRPTAPSGPRARRHGSMLRIDGETRSLDFVLFLPEGAEAQEFRLRTLSSINLLPERSAYRVWVNDTLLGTNALSAFVEPRSDSFAIPAGLVREGRNEVRVELNQHHRIYCGPEAAFALWSDIDLAASGAVIAGGASLPVLAAATPEQQGAERFMMALAATAASGQALEIRGLEQMGSENQRWLSDLAQRLNGALGGDPLPLRLGAYWGVASGSRAHARVTFLPASEPSLRFLRGGDGAEVMVIGYRPGSQPEMPDLGTILRPLIEWQEPQLIETTVPVEFSAFGLNNFQTADRYSLTEQTFRLPDDYAVLTNDKAEIRLTYVYEDGLPEGSMLQVHVNGTNIRLLPLVGEGGEVIRDFPLRFEARLLRPGVNLVSFESFVPGDPADLPCVARDTPMLAVSGGSTILAPYSPALYLPDMHFAFTALTPESVNSAELAGRAFTALDVVNLRAALQTAARPDAGEVDTRLHLIALDDLATVPDGGYSLSRAALERVLTAPSVVEAAPEAVTTSHMVLRSEGRDQSQDGGFGLRTAWNWVSYQFERAAQWLHPVAGRRLELWLEGRHAQAVLLQLDPTRPSELWLLRSPDADMGAITSAIVEARALGLGPRGQVALLDQEGRWQNWIAPDRQPVLLEPLSFGNFRHVLGNFVSAMPVRYVTGLFFLALISAVFALRFVLSTREKRQ